MAKYRNVSRTAIYKSVNKLVSKGYIRKIGKIYELTDIGKGGLHSLSPFSNKLRLHNLAIKLKILSSSQNWEKKRPLIFRLTHFNRNVDLYNNSYQLLSYSNIKVKTTNRSIILYLPSYYGDTTEECFRQALDSMFWAIPIIENDLKITILKDRKMSMEIISQEYARLQDALARIYKIQGNSFYVYDENNELRIISDFSFKINELDAVHPKYAKEDMDAIHPFLLDLIKFPTTFSEIKDNLREISKIQAIEVQKWQYYANKIEYHVDSIRKLGEGIEKNNKIMEEIFKLLKKFNK